jgi:DNA-3-methyladenine glycosylase II
MSSRKSARLSAASVLKEASNSSKKDLPQVANGSRKRKNAENVEVKTTSASPPKRKRKVTNDENAEEIVLSTPNRKRAVKVVPPATPTPAAVGLMSVPYSSGDVDDTPPPINRLVVLNGTNAPLVTPETHRLISQKPIDQVSPSKVPNIKSTTEDVLDKALAHLVQVEPKLQPVIDRHQCHVFSPEGLAEEIDPFRSLASGIISQQVS